MFVMFATVSYDLPSVFQVVDGSGCEGSVCVVQSGVSLWLRRSAGDGKLGREGGGSMQLGQRHCGTEVVGRGGTWRSPPLVNKKRILKDNIMYLCRWNRCPDVYCAGVWVKWPYRAIIHLEFNFDSHVAELILIHLPLCVRIMSGGWDARVADYNDSDLKF